MTENVKRAIEEIERGRLMDQNNNPTPGCYMLDPIQKSVLIGLLRSGLTNSWESKSKSEALDLLIVLSGGALRAKTGSEILDALPQYVVDTIQNDISEGKEIQAIKELRTHSGLGLKEAKELVENPKYFKQWIPPQ